MDDKLLDEKLLQDISARLQALGETVSEERLRKIVSDQFTSRR